MVGKVSALAADAVLGKAASRSARRAFRQRLRAAAAGVSIAFFMANHMAVTDTLMSFDLEHDFVTSAKTVGARAAVGVGRGYGGVMRCPLVLPSTHSCLQRAIGHWRGQEGQVAGGEEVDRRRSAMRQLRGTL